MNIFNHLFVSFLPYFCILSLTTIALIFSERAGIINLGINGVVVIGASFYMIFANLFSKGGLYELSGWIQIPLFILSSLGGLLFSLLHGFATIKLKANQIISGIALNILATAITITILFLFGNANRLPYNVNELAAGNAANYEFLNVVSLKVFITIIVIFVSSIILAFTRWGLRLKSIGENPQAADVAGINVNRNKWYATIISGILAGLAGAIYISSLSSGNTFKGNVEGLGFLAIAIMIVGRWKIIGSIVTAFLFSFLFSFGFQFKFLFPDQKESIINLIKMIPYIITILILIVFSKPTMLFFSKIFSSKTFYKLSLQASGPKAAGEAYDKAKR